VVFAVSDQRVQGFSGFIDGNKPVLVLKFRSKADLCKICTPVGCQLGLFEVEPSFSSLKVVRIRVTPEWGPELESVLQERKTEKIENYRN